MPVAARMADPSRDGRSTGFGILFHGPATQTSPGALLTLTRAKLALAEALAPS